MNLVSLEFAAFLSVVVLVYYFLSHRLQNYWLLAASYFFYATWSLWFPFVLGGLTIGNYWFAGQLAKQEKGRLKQVYLWLGILGNLGVLAVFKYTHFFMRGINKVLYELNTGESVVFQILFPLGLSYIVVQLIAYLVGISRKQIKPHEDFLEFALYLVYFPKIVAGPIEKFKTFLPRLTEPRTITNEQLSKSVTLIVLGLLRKTVFAELLFAIVPKTLTITPEAYSGSELYFWLIALGFYVYNDFAGYSDMVRGISGLFGIELMSNFNTPIFSRSISEFWLRWHISLSTWLRDYVYLPTSRWLLRHFRNPTHPLNLLIPPLVTMIASALWHDVTANIILWGVLMGIMMALSNVPLIFGWKVTPSAKQPLWRQSINLLFLMMILVVVVVPFFASIPTTFIIWKRFLVGGWSLPDIRIVIMTTLSFLVDWMQYHWGEFGILKWNPYLRAFLIGIVLLILVLVSLTDLDVQPFLYQEF